MRARRVRCRRAQAPVPGDSSRVLVVWGEPSGTSRTAGTPGLVRHHHQVDCDLAQSDPVTRIVTWGEASPP